MSANSDAELDSFIRELLHTPSCSVLNVCSSTFPATSRLQKQQLSFSSKTAHDTKARALNEPHQEDQKKAENLTAAEMQQLTLTERHEAFCFPVHDVQGGKVEQSTQIPEQASHLHDAAAETDHAILSGDPDGFALKQTCSTRAQISYIDDTECINRIMHDECTQATASAIDQEVCMFQSVHSSGDQAKNERDEVHGIDAAVHHDTVTSKHGGVAPADHFGLSAELRQFEHEQDCRKILQNN